MHRLRRFATQLQFPMQSRAASQSLDSSVLIEEVSGNYLVTLNRPKALNALNLDMIHTLTNFYQQLIQNESKCKVVMRGMGKAFCAGGDVRNLYDMGKAGKDVADITKFFKYEYILDDLLCNLPKNIENVCLIHGITMGGGVGLSVHGRFRVATESTLFAMPETGIGFYTDVGGSHFLPRLVPHGLGLYLALNGHRLKGCDVLHAGIATHFVTEPNLDILTQELLNTDASAACVLAKYSTHAAQLPAFTLIEHLDNISKVFSDAKDVEQIVADLQQIDNDWAANTLKQLHSVSPTALKLVFRALNEGKTKNLRECLDMEFKIVSQCMQQHDFYEGIRAQLVDKDRNPQWKPKELKQVTDEHIDLYFK